MIDFAEQVTAAIKLVAAAIEWRHACETDDDAETERLVDAVDAYEAANDDTGIEL